MVMIEQNLGESKTAPIDLEREPHRVAERERLSASVIDEKRRATWGDVGLILSAPPENIRNIYKSDAGTPWYEGREEEHTLSCTVEELLEQTRPGSYNEVVLTGHTATGNIELQGFFVKVYSDREYVDEEMARKVRYLANYLELPIIEILDQSPRMSSEQRKRTDWLRQQDTGDDYFFKNFGDIELDF